MRRLLGPDAPFRRRLALVSAVAVAVAVVLACSIVFLVVRGQLRGQVDSSLEELAGRASAHMPLPPPDAGVEPVPFELPAPPPGGAPGVGQLLTPEGDVLRPPGDPVRLPVGSEARAVAAGAAEPFFSDVEVGGEHLRLLTTRTGDGGAIQVARSLEETDSSLQRLALVLGVVGLGGIGLGILLGWLISRTTAVNQMVAELERAVRAQRELVADASHELRTPLTSLRTNVEVLALPNGLSASDRRRLLSDVTDQLDELGVLVGNLADLARDEEPAPMGGDVNLDELVAECLARAGSGPSAPAWEAALEPCVVRGDPERLRSAVANLLDNAAKWSPPGAVVGVSARDGEVTVRDHGPGIAEADRERVFDRFYRAPEARGMRGSGLGLAIVRQVAEAHGGNARAEPAPGGGALLRLTLPVTTAAVS